MKLQKRSDRHEETDSVEKSDLMLDGNSRNMEPVNINTGSHSVYMYHTMVPRHVYRDLPDLLATRTSSM